MKSVRGLERFSWKNGWIWSSGSMPVLGYSSMNYTVVSPAIAIVNILRLQENERAAPWYANGEAQGALSIALLLPPHNGLMDPIYA